MNPALKIISTLSAVIEALIDADSSLELQESENSISMSDLWEATLATEAAARRVCVEAVNISDSSHSCS